MDLKTLREKGGFVPSVPEKREVSWTHIAEDGTEVTDTFTVFIRKVSCGVIDRIQAAARAAVTGGGPGISQRALVISEAVLLGEDGTERLSYAEAEALDPSLAEVLTGAINAVNSGEASSKN